LRIMEQSDRLEIHFEPIKESRGEYFVEYYPPAPAHRFASLQVIFPENAALTDIATKMEQEVSDWIAKYPVPIMASAFDDSGDLYDLNTVRPFNHVVGYLAEDESLKLCWHLITDDDLPDNALDGDFLKSTYAGISYRTSEDIKRKADKDFKQLRIGFRIQWLFIFFWGVIVPAIIATLGWKNEWVSFLAFGYSILKAYIAAMKLLGKWPKTQQELDQEREKEQMEHHHYHCKLNPEGFRRLMAENFERLERERILAEAELLEQKRLDKNTLDSSSKAKSNTRSDRDRA
jgi:hypothetical protein